MGVAVVIVVAMGFEAKVSGVAMRFLGFIWVLDILFYYVWMLRIHQFLVEERSRIVHSKVTSPP